MDWSRINLFARQGWQCPICGRVYSPDTSVCWYCGKGTTVDSTPTAQSEIIHCKDCKHYKAYDYTGKLACHYVIGGTVEKKPDDFCSRAERLTNGTNSITWSDNK